MTYADLAPAAGGQRRRAARRLRAPLSTALALGAGAGALALRDPHVQHSWGFCPFLVLTGLPCPLCGGLRAVNDLTHGDVQAAVAGNAFVVVGVLPALVAVVTVWTWRRLRGDGGEEPPLTSARSAAVFMTLMLAWGAVRLVVPGHLLA